MAEMKIVDLAHYLYLKDQVRYVQQLSNECKEALSEDGDFGRQAEQMRRNKQLLPRIWILILYDAIMYFGDFDIFNIF